MWQLVGREGRVTALLRTVALRLARATGGGVSFWLELPISELIAYTSELNDQLAQENAAAKGVS